MIPAECSRPAEHRDWRDQSIERVQRLLLWVLDCTLTGLVVAFVSVCVAQYAHAAQTCGTTWTLTSITPATGFTDAAHEFGASGCAGFDAWVVGFGGVVDSCSVAGHTLTGHAHSASFVDGWTYVYAQDCTGTPDPTGVDIDWSNASHLSQALLVAACGFAMVFGYRAGDRV